MTDQEHLAALVARLRGHVSPEAHHVVIDEAFVLACVVESLALVGHMIGANTVPEAIRDRAVIEAGSELFHRRAAPNGISQFASGDGSPVRIARDPMNAARAIIQPFLPLGFA